MVYERIEGGKKLIEAPFIDPIWLPSIATP